MWKTLTCIKRNSNLRFIKSQNPVIKYIYRLYLMILLMITFFSTTILIKWSLWYFFFLANALEIFRGDYCLETALVKKGIAPTPLIKKHLKKHVCFLYLHYNLKNRSQTKELWREESFVSIFLYIVKIEQ